jgi:hypothetical protein
MKVSKKTILRVVVYTVLAITLLLPWRDWISPLEIFPFPARLAGWQSLWVDLSTLGMGVLMWHHSELLGGVLMYGLWWVGDCAPIVGVLGFITVIRPRRRWIRSVYLTAAAVSFVGLVFSAVKHSYTVLLWGYWLCLCLVCIVIGMEAMSIIAERAKRRDSGQ